MDIRCAPTLALAGAVAHAVVGVAVLLLWLAGAPAHAQDSGSAEPPSGIGTAIELQVRQLALAGAKAGAKAGEQGLGEAIDSPPPRIEIGLGQLDPRLRLAPCQQVEPYLPPGARLWGKTRIGLRCLRGAARWNVYLPITIKVMATALVATNGGVAGSVLSAADLTQAEVDLAEDNSPAIGRPELAVGRVLARALRPGQSLRQTHLRARQWFAAGETVTVSAEGSGFSVAGEGQALSNGIEGQTVRVRTDNGRIISGLPVGDRRVELNL